MKDKPELPTELRDELLDSLERISAVADLLSTIGPYVCSDHLRPRTISIATSIIDDETKRALRLLEGQKTSPSAP